ncbi:uncharacterized protein HD556DRAFT_1435285 [Suillus plorans]|uniref:CxC2-like cysteine cluster KDZ transposase-associated domain-containing protein n=1 Tax=Suillus plorans TaxID=116603 RepID=A0A9P7A9R5_9AGAM|nr:uncharacterized protein HD556DRAFT_1435285 [Suillus plorans]KAG1785033.1 hypothetical protein HD556DRAFT_1435285 [Suillus plorans]
MGDDLPDKRKWHPANNPLLAWLPERQSFLDETIFLEGRAQEAQRTHCRCGNHDNGPKYRCRDCFGMEMACHYCIVKHHQCSPLHNIEEWNGSFFQRIKLKTLGLRIQLGHTPSDRCFNPRPSKADDFVVININSIHEVALDFSRWYPATTTDPQTAATFNVLEHFHLLSYESKISAYKFFHGLARRTDNTGLRGGRGHDPGGIAETKAGELAVLCLACPHPGKNLPSGWEHSPPGMRWLYALFIAIDANFCLKWKAVSSDQMDPGLNAGWAYFVEERTYKSYLSERAGERQECSTCVSHNAVNMADTKSSRGLAATGIGTINCARHEFKLPNGVGDLQKGERYLNMDYLVFSALVGFTVTMLNISYDIACQWSKKLWNRMDHMPTHLHIPRNNMLVQYFVPKFHIAAHVAACQVNFSWNLTKWVGRTDGEVPEWGWANANRIASSTKEMGPGTRCDTLDDHFGDWNWKKTTTLGRTLKCKMEEATKWEREHCAALCDLEATVQPALLEEWELEVQTWEEDNTRPNPFESKVAPITQAAVRSQLAESEAQDSQAGINHSLNIDVSPSVLISGGIELEDMQQRLKRDIANLSLHPTDKQREAIIHRTSALQRHINSWTRYQQLYMPIISTLRSSADMSASAPQAALRPQDFPLYLPSALNYLNCDQCLMEYEWELRWAQAHDALNELRSHLRLCSHMYKFKDKHLRGQAASTHAQNLIASVEAKKDAAVDKYKCAHQALESLSSWVDKMGWEERLRPLRHEDAQPMGDFAAGRSQGTGTISWIWLVSDGDTSHSENERVQDCVRIEWCKARARAAQWFEEVELLAEEMRRVLTFLEWQGNWWQERAVLRPLEKITQQEGLHAYAYCQAALRFAMQNSFQARWNFVPQLNHDDGGPSIDAPPVVVEFEEQSGYSMY